MDSFKQTIKNEELIRQIHQKHPEYLIKDLTEIFKLIEEATLDNLRKGSSVKLGKLVKLEVVDLPARVHYDGINHKTIKLSKRKVIKIKQLVKLKSLYK